MKTFGDMTIEDDPKGRVRRAWRIRCEPHVALRLKRLFARLDKGEFGTLRVVDTPEVARDLRWFLQRYPLDLDPASADYLAARAAEHAGRERLVYDILTCGRPPAPCPLAIPLRAYQAAAVELALSAGGLLIADDVGLGKTAQGIGVVADPRARPALVVTLTHLPGQWAAEFARFAPDLVVYAAKTGSPAELVRRERAHPLFRPDVYILNYHKLRGWAETLAPRIRCVVFDEIQELRHNGSDKYAAAKHLADSAAFRLGLSATPIFNYGGELHNVLDVLRPDALGSRAEFVREWCGGSFSDRPSVADPRAFGAYLRDEGLMVRRTRSEVARELPALTKIREAVDHDVDELARVEDAASELARVILAVGGSPLEKGRASEELSWRIRQATGIAKARPVADFVRMLLEAGERVVLFGWHREVYTIWGDRLSDFRPGFFTGSETARRKAEALDRFKAGDTPLLIMSLRAGAGVDGLQSCCRTVVFGELDWAHACHEQCIGRVHRDGQDDPVFAYFLVSDGGSDPVVADVLGLKRKQLEGIRDPDLPLVERLQVDPGHVRRLAERYLGRKSAVGATP